MRKINNTPILIAAFMVILAGCGKKESSVSEIVASGDLELIHDKKKELSGIQKELTSEIALLDSAITAKSGKTNLPLITTFLAKSRAFSHYVELQGDVTTQQNLLVYPEVAGVLMKIHVDEGDVVRKGQLLGTIDQGGLGSQLAQMKTQLALAETTYERQKRLWAENIGSEIQFLQAKANYEAQKSAVDQMQSQLDKFFIRAPFGGIVDNIIKDQGAVVSPGPGSEVFRVVNLSDMFIEVLVPETYLPNITKGKEVQVFFPILNETIDSKVRETSNYINPDNRSFRVKIPVPNKNGQIKPNLTAKVKLNDYYQENAILIPQSIISENAEGEQYAYIVSDIQEDNTAIASRRIIQTGKSQDGYVEVISGIANGTSIILEGARSVEDGQKVQILKD